MLPFTASAPCKCILFGEHYVVYGAPALSIAIGPRNSVEFSGGGKGGMALHSIYGDGLLSAGGRFSGPREQELYVAVAKHIFGAAPVPSCSVGFSAAWGLKGVGVSSSLCAAFAAGLFRMRGEKPSAGEIFAAAQSGDIVAHGGRASGIDAKTVSFGGALIFQRKFSPPAFDASPLKFKLPASSALLLIDTFAGKKSATAEMVAQFAKSFGIAKPPQELREEERAEVRREYEEAWGKVKPALAKADAKLLGSLMNENHALLKSRGVSSGGIEKAVSSALAAGAYGAKLTAAGGEGGAVLVLCEKKKEREMRKKIMAATGFACHPTELSSKGAHVD